MIEFPETAMALLEMIESHNYDAYLVGGCVRDALLGRKTYDIDISTNMPFDMLKEIFKAYTPQFFESYGNLSFKHDQYQIEITRFRKEGKYINHRHPSTLDFEASLFDDLERRDFTVNALLYHREKGILDYVEGLSDLNNKMLRTIKEPLTTFQEDYLRMLRLMRFKSQLNFDIEPETLRACKTNFYKISHLSWSQIFPEFIKFIETDNFVSVCMEYPFILSFLIVEMHIAYEFDQNNRYHKYSLYEHTLRVVDQLNGKTMRLVGLFHDLGKIQTKVIKESGDYGYPGHGKASVEIAKQYLDPSYVDRDLILKLIAYHDVSIPVDYIAMKHMVKEHGLDFMQMLIDFKRADNIAKSQEAAYQIDKCDQYLSYLDKIEKEKPVLSLKKLAIKGDDLNIEPKLKGNILNRLLDGVIDETLENDKTVLLKEVEKWDIS